MAVVQQDNPSDFVLGKGAGHKTALRPKAQALLKEARKSLNIKTGLAKLNNRPEPHRLRLYGEAEYQAKSWKGLDTRSNSRKGLNLLIFKEILSFKTAVFF